MSRTVLITGVAGFIGSNLADYLLAKNFRVVGVDNLAYGVRAQIPKGVEFHQVDIRSPDLHPLFRSADTVFHLAAKNCISDCQLDPVETSDINITGTVNVFEAARKAGVRKVVYAESSALYEGSPVMPTPETEAKPESFYAISKLAGMEFAKAYERYYGLTTTALRYFCVYGPRQDYRRTIPPVMSAFIIKLLQRQVPTIYGTGEKRRDFIHVDDINDFHLLCIDEPKTDHGVFNLGSGVNHSVNDVFNIIEGVLKTGIKPIHKPDMPGEANETLADISAAARLGWRPQTTIEVGLERMIRYIEGNVLPVLA